MKIKPTITLIILCSLTNTAFSMHNMSEDKVTLAKLTEQQETPTKTVVPMWGAKHRLNNPKEIAASTIETSGLIECIATAAIIKYQNNCSCSIMTHFPPTHHLDHGEALKEQIKLCNEKAQSPVTSSHVEILVPGEYKQNTNNDSWRLQAQTDTKDIVRLLDSTHKTIQGNSATSSITPYTSYRGKDLDSTYTPDLTLYHQNNKLSLYCNNICNTSNIGFNKK